MKTRLEKKGLAYIVSFEGKLHFDDQDAVRDHLEKLLNGIQKTLPKGPAKLQTPKGPVTDSQAETSTTSYHGSDAAENSNTVPLLSDEDLIPFSSTDRSPRRVVFNFQHLEFVGSSGITPFLHLLSEFSVRAPLPTSLCHVGSEFKQMIRALTQSALWDFFETEDQALYSGPRPRLDQ